MVRSSIEQKRVSLPRFTVKFANAIFILGATLSFSVVIYSIYFLTTRPYYVVMFVGIICTTLLLCGLWLKDHIKVNLSIFLFMTGICIYALEISLWVILPPTSIRQQTAKEIGVPYDTRTKFEMVEDLRRDGLEAYPNVFPKHFWASNGLETDVTHPYNNIDNRRVYPLGGISNITTIFENENGFYPIIQTDEHGFNNPKKLYTKGKVDIVLTGDSFTEGFSVNPDQTISAILRNLGFNAINLGKGDNGSLIEFAALREYAKPLEPKVVLWLYCGGDINSLHEEIKAPLLRKYLEDDDFSQRLIVRQNEIDNALIDFVQTKEVEWRKRQNIVSNPLIAILKLTHFRQRINLVAQTSYPPPPISTFTPKYNEILEKSNRLVSKWGGQFYFVYLTQFPLYAFGQEDPERDYVLKAAIELNIPVIDVHKDVFINHPDPLSLFPFRLMGHYNAEGYKLVAEAIAKRLQTDGILRSKMNE